MKDGQAVVSTPCPAIVSYVQKYMPALHGALVNVVSPMIAVARAIRHRHGAGVRVVFIGPCIAKKAEIKDPFVQGTVDAVLTYEELLAMFQAAGIHPEEEAPGAFDGPAANLGRSLPISGGLLRAAGFDADILQNSVLVTEGKDRVLPALKELAEGKSKARVLDVLFCEGCINGPKMTNTMSVFARKEMLTDHINEQTLSMGGRDMAESLIGVPACRPVRGTSPSRRLRCPSPRRRRFSRRCAGCASSAPRTSSTAAPAAIRAAGKRRLPSARALQRWACACPTSWKSWKARSPPCSAHTRPRRTSSCRPSAWHPWARSPRAWPTRSTTPCPRSSCTPISF